MCEAILCRVKFAVLLILFFVPIAVAAWSSKLDAMEASQQWLAPAPLASSDMDSPSSLVADADH